MREEYGPIRDEDVVAACDLLSWAYAFSLADAEPWVRKSFDEFRVLRREGRPVATAMILSLGQFFGGRRVPMAGVAAVATAPDARGTGAATTLMSSLVTELHEADYALAMLYPSTRSLYRRSGFEPAGGHFVVSVPTHLLRARDRELELRPMTDADREEIVGIYRSQASRTPGNLDRNDYIWDRVLKPRGERAKGFVCVRDGSIEGHVVLTEKRPGSSLHYDLTLTDLVAITPEAAKRLLTFLADHGSLAQRITWKAGPGDPFVQLLGEPGYELKLTEHWMLRIVDVQKALAERGYLEGIEIELHMEVRDEVVAANDGRFVLQIAGGRGSVRRGGRGRLQIDVRGLAPLYSGQLSPQALEATGLLAGTEGELAKAAAVFAGPYPWCPDFF